MIASQKPYRQRTFDESLAAECDKLLEQSTGKIAWRLRRTTIAPGRRALLSVCGRFRIVEAKLIDGVAIRKNKRGHPVAFHHAMRRTENPPGNFTWDLLSTHRTESAAKHACQLAARPPSKQPPPKTSRSAKSSRP